MSFKYNLKVVNSLLYLKSWFDYLQELTLVLNERPKVASISNLPYKLMIFEVLDQELAKQKWV